MCYLHHESLYLKTVANLRKKINGNVGVINITDMYFLPRNQRIVEQEQQQGQSRACLFCEVDADFYAAENYFYAAENGCYYFSLRLRLQIYCLYGKEEQIITTYKYI